VEYTVNMTKFASGMYSGVVEGERQSPKYFWEGMPGQGGTVIQ